jgi:hypothetical protein
LREYTKADLLRLVGERMPVFVRYSSAAGSATCRAMCVVSPPDSGPGKAISIWSATVCPGATVHTSRIDPELRERMLVTVVRPLELTLFRIDATRRGRRISLKEELKTAARVGRSRNQVGRRAHGARASLAPLIKAGEPCSGRLFECQQRRTAPCTSKARSACRSPSCASACCRAKSKGLADIS